MKIQREQGARRSLQNIARIEPFINGLKKYSAVIEVFVQAKPELMAFIWVVQLLDCTSLLNHYDIVYSVGTDQILVACMTSTTPLISSQS